MEKYSQPHDSPGDHTPLPAACATRLLASSQHAARALFSQRIRDHFLNRDIFAMQGMREEAIAFLKSLFAAFDKLDQVFRVFVFPPIFRSICVKSSKFMLSAETLQVLTA